MLEKIVLLFITIMAIIGILNYNDFFEKDMKYITIGRVKIYSVSNKAEILFLDESVGDRIRTLYNSSEPIFIFHGQAVGGKLKKDMYLEAAEENARGALSRFVETTVEIFQQRIEVRTGMSLSKSAYRELINLSSSSKQGGAKLIAAWMIPIDGIVYEYHGLLFYDPTMLATMISQNELIKREIYKLNMQPKEFFEILNEAFKEAKP